MLVDPNMHEVTHFCLPHLKGILKHTTSYTHEVIGVGLISIYTSNPNYRNSSAWANSVDPDQTDPY